MTDVEAGHLIPDRGWDRVDLHTVTAYSGWGAKVSIKKPPAGTVSDVLLKG
ncbi:hypothetical protein [Herbidospora daliensis]|uniref:hypothetical protein n=1 Tax=Herbidospora daliensis TaxID=295585 RepID=UPI000A648B74|nr:hypothetical protein [Herbidospora daliensis]